MEQALRRAAALAAAAWLLLAGCGPRGRTAGSGAPAAPAAARASCTVSPDSMVYTYFLAAETLRVEFQPGAGDGDDDLEDPADESGVEITAGHGPPLIVGGELDSPEPWACLDSLSGRDLNGDGHLEVVLERRTGDCPLCRDLLVAGVTAGRAVVLSPGMDRGRAPCDARSLRGDGRYQLLVPDDSWRGAYGFADSTGPVPLRAFAWNGREYADSTAAFPEFLEAGAEMALSEARSLESRGDTGERWLGRLAEHVLYAGLLGRGRAEMDTLRAHLDAHPAGSGAFRATCSEVRRALERRFPR